MKQVLLRHPTPQKLVTPPARAGCGLKLVNHANLGYAAPLLIVTPPARAGCGLKLVNRLQRNRDGSPRPRGRGAD